MNLEERLKIGLASQAWQRIGIKHHHGINIPLFSLHSAQSCGIGEYLDLIPVIDWCVEVGFDIIQLLPLYDTGMGQSPYSALSSTALHPIYLRLQQLPGIETLPDYKQKIQHLQQWNTTPRVRYSLVYDAKRLLLKEYLDHHMNDFLELPTYKTFSEHNHWLTPYALFKTLKQVYPSGSWNAWPSELQNPSESALKYIAFQHEKEIAHHKILQFLCFQQLSSVKHYAQQKGVLLKGDLPILLDKESVDVWYYRKYFILDYEAGAPPDRDYPQGQRWGFPLYRWETLAQDQFSFWKTRLDFAQPFFDLYRLDHAVGFYRIWGLPSHSSTSGQFFPSQEHEWLQQGSMIMRTLIQYLPLLPIAEDLGCVPQSVRDSLQSYSIPGTKVMRWERYWNGDQSFIPINAYQPISMTTVSTHDSDTLTLWWKNAPQEAQVLCTSLGWHYTPTLSSEKLFELLRQSHHSTSLFHINLWHEYFALFPDMIAPNPSDERINYPGQVLATNWTYRFRLTLENILEHHELKKTIKEIVRP